jgi:cytoskeletal protein RodZ
MGSNPSRRVVTDQEKPKLKLSPAQLGAGAAATITMSLVGSFFGPSGTLVAAALTSVTSTVATTVYQHVLTISGQHAKRIIAKRPGESDKHFQERVEEAAEAVSLEEAKRDRRFSPKMLALPLVAAAGIFLGVMGLNTSVEAVAGKPVSAIVQGKPGSGTTLGGGDIEEPTPSPTSSSIPTATQETSQTPDETTPTTRQRSSTPTQAPTPTQVPTTLPPAPTAPPVPPPTDIPTPEQT